MHYGAEGVKLEGARGGALRKLEHDALRHSPNPQATWNNFKFPPIIVEIVHVPLGADLSSSRWKNDRNCLEL